MKLTELRPVFVDTIPNHLEDGVLYVSEKYSTAIHNCVCGWCGWKVVTPLTAGYGWSYKRTDDDKVTLYPSIGNQQFPCHSHYWIKENQVVRC